MISYTLACIFAAREHRTVLPNSFPDPRTIGGGGGGSVLMYQHRSKEHGKRSET